MYVFRPARRNELVDGLVLWHMSWTQKENYSYKCHLDSNPPGYFFTGKDTTRLYFHIDHMLVRETIPPNQEPF